MYIPSSGCEPHPGQGPPVSSFASGELHISQIFVVRLDTGRVMLPLSLPPTGLRTALELWAGSAPFSRPITMDCPFPGTVCSPARKQVGTSLYINAKRGYCLEAHHGHRPPYFAASK